MRLLNSVTVPKNVKKDALEFLASILLQNIKKMKKVAFMIHLETTIAKSAIDAEINRAQML